MTGSNSFWLANPSKGFYNNVIDQSLRYSLGDSPYLTRTGDSGNRRTFTFSAWFKRSSFNNTNSIFGAVLNGTNFFMIRFRDVDDPDGGKLQIGNYSGSFDMDLRTTQVFRDITNWYHIVVAVDTTQSTDSDRVKLYINGSQVTSFSTETYPSQNFETRVSNGHSEQVGAEATSYSYIDGYLAEVNFIDGTALTPSSFGETKDGVWIPKAISGLTYGTNGFRLTFADSSSLGDDTSGNGNDFTSSGLASTDVVLDTPENNFATLNLLQTSNNASTFSFSEGNLALTVTNNSGYRNCSSTFSPMGIKGYFEFSVVSGTPNFYIGVLEDTTFPTNMDYADLTHNYTMLVHNSGVYQNENIASQGNRIVRGGSTYLPHNIGTIAAGDVLGLAFDFTGTNRRIWFHRANTYGTSSTGVGNPSTGANPVQSETYLDSTSDYRFHFGINTGSGTQKLVVNFGQDGTFAGNETAQGNTDANGNGDFYYAVPTDFVALCTASLPDVTIGPSQSSQADDFFNTVLYSGANNATQSITDVGFQPDWSWFKSRSNASDHYLFDSPRGANKSLSSNDTGVEDSTSGQFTQFTATGFDLPADNAGYVNYTGRTYVAWNWRAGGEPTADNSAGAGNTPTSGSVKIDGSNKSDALAGTIAATRLTANTTSGFSVVTYTGNNGSSGTIAHGLNSAPEWVLIFGRNVSNSQMLGVTPMGFTKYASFQTTGGYFVSDSTIWNNTAPTSTVFTVGSAQNVNDAYNYVAYCFHSVDGYSKIGTYTGNGSVEGPYAHLGFRPAWLFVKRTNNTGGAIIWDNKRSTSNPTDDYLVPQLQDDEELNNSTQRVDFLSNGFKVRNGSTSNSINGSGSTYLYLAFAEQPFKFSNAR